MIISRTPLRISLVGGGTDMPAFYEQDPETPGRVVSFSIDKYVYVILNKKFDHGFRVSYSENEYAETVEEIKHDIIREALKLVRRAGDGLEIVTIADVSGHGTGLGSSSALAVGLANTLNAYIDGPLNDDKGALAEIGYVIEAQKCKHVVGKQDHYAAAYGGFNHIKFERGFAKVKEIESGWDSEYPWNLNDLNEGFLLLWTGNVRQASSILGEQSRNLTNPETYAIGKEMASLAFHLDRELTEAVRDPMPIIGEYLRRNWELKKKLQKDISDPQIDFWYEIAMQNGALGGKLCGAGGGGFLLFAIHPDAYDRISRATGLRPMPFRITTRGSEVMYGP